MFPRILPWTPDLPRPLLTLQSLSSHSPTRIICSSHTAQLVVSLTHQAISLVLSLHICYFFKYYENAHTPFTFHNSYRLLILQDCLSVTFKKPSLITHELSFLPGKFLPSGNFPGGPVVKNSPGNAGGHGFNPCSGH